MTRGIISVKDSEQEQTLYLSSDAYVGGCMNLAIEYCDVNHGKRMSVKELAFDLLKAIAGTEVYTQCRNPGLDYVYTVQLNHGECPNDFVYQKVLANCNYDEPIPSALSETRFYRADMEGKNARPMSIGRIRTNLMTLYFHVRIAGKRGGTILRLKVKSCIVLWMSAQAAPLVNGVKHLKRLLPSGTDMFCRLRKSSADP